MNPKRQTYTNDGAKTNTAAPKTNTSTKTNSTYGSNYGGVATQNRNTNSVYGSNYGGNGYKAPKGAKIDTPQQPKKPKPKVNTQKSVYEVPDELYKDSGFYNPKNDIYHEDRVSGTYNALKKEQEDANKEGDLSLKDVITFNQETKQNEFVDYASPLEELYKTRDDLKAQEQAAPQLYGSNYGGIVNALPETEEEIARKGQLKDVEDQIADLERKQKYQEAVIDEYALNDAEKKGDTETIESLYKKHASYDDPWIAKRAENIGAIGVNMASAVASTVDIIRDLSGEAYAKELEDRATTLYNDGGIDDTTFNNMMEFAKQQANFDAADPNTLGGQFREAANQIAYEIANGQDGIGKFIGEGLDSTANFLAQFLLFGEGGSLAMMSTQSGVQKYFANLEKGYSKEVALANAIATGLTSYLTERIGMDNFVSIVNGTKGQSIIAQLVNAMSQGRGTLGVVAESILSQAAAEGLEEVVEANADFVLDSLTAKMFNGEPVEYNVGDIFYAMAVGAFSGGITGLGGYAIGSENYKMVVNTKEQYNNLKHDVEAAINLRNEAAAKGEDVSDLDLAINSGSLALRNFEAKNPVSMATTIVGEDVNTTLDTQGVAQKLDDILFPNVADAVKTSLDNESLIENIYRMSQDFLLEKGIDMPVDQLVSMSEDERQAFLEKDAKIRQAFPNVQIAYNDEVSDEDGNIVNAKVIKTKGQSPQIVVNPHGDTSVIISAVHEIVHTIENSPEYKDIVITVFENEEALNKKVDELTGEGGRYEGADSDEGKAEALTVTLTEDMMKEEGAQEFIDHMAKYNTSTAYKLWYQFRDIMGLFKDNSTLGRITSMLTDALAKQDMIYMPDGVSFSQIATTPKQVEKAIDDVKNGTISIGDKSYALPMNGVTLLPNGRLSVQMTDWQKDLGYSVAPNLAYIGAILNNLYDQNDPSTNVFRDSSNHQGGKNPVDVEILKHIDVFFGKPYGVFKSGSSTGTAGHFIVLKATDKRGFPIIMSVSGPQANNRGGYIQVKFHDFNDVLTNYRANMGTSVYGKNGPNNNLVVKNWLNNLDLLWSENGGVASTDPATYRAQKNQVLQDVDNLQQTAQHGTALRTTNNLTLVDSSISRIFNKAKQLEMIEKAKTYGGAFNGANIDEWKTKVERIDIKTLDQILKKADPNDFTEDYTLEDMEDAINDGYITIYSMMPIRTGAFVTPSKQMAMEALEDEILTTGNKRKLYTKTVFIDNVAWYDTLNGQYAPLKDEIQHPKLYKAFNLIDSNSVSDEYRDNFVQSAREALTQYYENLNKKWTWNDDLYGNEEVRAVMDELDRIAQSYPLTIDDWDNRGGIHDGMLDEYIAKEVEGKTKGRKCLIYIGIPSSGKSTAGAREGKRRLNAVELDNDISKALTPEVKAKGGIMANAVHEESSLFTKELQHELIQEGYNLVVPMVGAKKESVIKMLDELTENDYDIGVVFVDVTIEEGLQRLISRFVSKNRWIMPKVLQNAGNGPSEVYEYLKDNYKGGVRFYEKIDNNGKTAVSVETVGDKSGFFEGQIEGVTTGPDESTGVPQSSGETQGERGGVLDGSRVSDAGLNESTDSFSKPQYSRRQDNKGKELSEGQNNYFKNSFARDYSGRLVRVYHGSFSPVYTILDPKKTADKVAYFFTDNPKIAATYFNRQYDDNYLFAPSKDDAIDESKTKRIYETYLNLENPMVICEADAKEWTNLPRTFMSKEAKAYNYFTTVDDFNKFFHDNGLNMKAVETNGGSRFSIVDNKGQKVSWLIATYPKSMDPSKMLKAIDKMNGTDYYNTYFGSIAQEGWPAVLTTDDIAEYAYKNGYDGVIYKNIRDGSGYDSGRLNEPSNVYVMFEANQAKSVNNLNPTEDPDIRYSRKVNVDSAGKALTKTQINRFKDSYVRDAQGRLLRVYHGTDSPMFTIFDPNMSDDKRSLFFTSDPKVASTYFKEKFKENRLFAPSKDSGLNADNKRVYEVYLDIENPLVVVGGKDWFDLPKDYLNGNSKKYNYFASPDDYNSLLNDLGIDNYRVRLKADGKNYSVEKLKDDGSWTYTKDLGKAVYMSPRSVLENLDERFGLNLTDEYISELPSKYLNSDRIYGGKKETSKTRLYSEFAKENGYDGVIIKNIKDSGHYELYDKPSDIYIAFNSNQVKSVNNDNPTDNPDIRYSRKKKNTNSVSNPREGVSRVQGEVVDGYAERKKQQFRENSIENSDIFNKEQKERTRQMSAEGYFHYTSLINKVELQRAREYMEKDGVDKTYDNFMANNNPTVKSVIQGELLLEELAKNNDKRWEDVAIKLADDSTVFGQGLQAYAIMQRLTPQGQLVAIERNLRRMQAEMDRRYGNKAPQLELKPELVEELRKAKTGGQAKEVRDKIMKDLIGQQPITFTDMIDSWRYLSMLGNPRTHIRNFLGNAIFMPAIGLKNAIGTGLEKIAGSKLEYKTKSFVSRFNESDKALYKAGQEAYEAHRQSVEHTQKYEQKGFTEKTKLGKVLNKADELNTWLLDKEDFLFSKDRYALSYAQFLKANNLSPDSLSPDMEARANTYALNESLKATYRDANDIASWLNQLETSDKEGLRMAGYAKKAILPFTKTPFNIVKRGAAYSPLGILKTIYDGAVKVRKGTMDANTWLDELASGLSGTAIAGLGLLLANMGIFRTKDDDKDRKKYFDQENGEQDYAIDLGDGTYTIDWATPVIMPLAMGKEFGEIFEELQQVDGAESALNSLLAISANIMDPIVETTMLSSLQSAMSSYSNEGGAYFGDVVASAIASYIGQMFPTLGGQVARIIDDTRRTTSPNKGLIDKTMRQIRNKVPFLSMKNQPYINKQGQEEKSEDLGMGWVGRTFLNMFSPGYYSSKDIDKYDEELYRLYDKTGEMDVLPSSTSKSVTFDKQTFKFTPEEYTEWHKKRWSTESKYVNQFIDSNSYKNMNDQERFETIKDIRGYAQKVAKKQFLESKGYVYTDDKELADKDPKYIYDKELANANAMLDEGVDLYAYYDYLNNAGTKQAEKVQYLEDTDLSQSQKEKLYGLSGYKTSYQDAFKKVSKETSETKENKSTSSEKSSGSSRKSSGGKSSRKSSRKGSKSVKKSGGSISKGRMSLIKNPGIVKLDTQNVKKNYLNAYSSTMRRGSKNVSQGSSSGTVCPRCGNRVSSSNGRCPICGAQL